MTLSDTIKRKLRRYYERTKTPYPVDNKVVNFAQPASEPGQSCMSCWYYHLETELEEGVPPPEYTPVKLAEDMKAYRSKEPDVKGFCTILHPIMITNVPPDYGCDGYLEKAKELQFDDDILEDGTDLFAGPIRRSKP